MSKTRRPEPRFESKMAETSSQKNDKHFSESSEEEAFIDILDGDVAKEHLQGMDNNYQAWCS